MSKSEFTILGNTMENLSIKYGIFLIIWGAGISWISQSGSITSWIPAFLGFPIFLFGWLSRLSPKRKKAFMHIVVLFGFLVFLGGLDFIRGIGSDLGPFSNLYVASTKLILLLSGGSFCFYCVKSFKYARLNNQ